MTLPFSLPLSRSTFQRKGLLPKRATLPHVTTKWSSCLQKVALQKPTIPASLIHALTSENSSPQPDSPTRSFPSPCYTKPSNKRIGGKKYRLEWGRIETKAKKKTRKIIAKPEFIHASAPTSQPLSINVKPPQDTTPTFERATTQTSIPFLVQWTTTLQTNENPTRNLPEPTTEIGPSPHKLQA